MSLQENGHEAAAKALPKSWLAYTGLELAGCGALLLCKTTSINNAKLSGKAPPARSNDEVGSRSYYRRACWRLSFRWRGTMRRARAHLPPALLLALGGVCQACQAMECREAIASFCRPSTHRISCLSEEAGRSHGLLPRAATLNQIFGCCLV
jgi:hypothetical protein